MALNLTAVRDGAATVLDGVAGLRTYARVPGQIQPPAAVVTPAGQYIDRNQSGSRGPVLVSFEIGLMVPLSDVDRAQRQLDTLIVDVLGVLAGDKTLNGSVASSHVAQVSGHDEVDVGGVSVLGCRLSLTAAVRESDA